MTLLKKISEISFLHNAWTKLNRSNKNSKGFSNITIADFDRKLNENIKQISDELISEQFQFSKIKGATIKKQDGGQRPLRIPEIKDRVVLKAIAIVLEDELSDKFNLYNPYSFAYQKGKSIAQAISRMRHYYNEGYQTILEADIVKFFDNVDRNKLLETIKTNISDPSLNNLLDEALNQEIANIKELQNRGIYEDLFKSTENGIPQGNPLSPLLANIYLSSFDALASTKDLKLIRYADDFIILCKSYEEAKRAYLISKSEIEGNLGLDLYSLVEDRKEQARRKCSKILNVKNQKFSFLSIRFDGTKTWVEEAKFEEFLSKIERICIPNTSTIDLSLLDSLVRLRNLLEGWIAAYHFADIDFQAKAADAFVNVYLYRLFSRHNFQLNKKYLINTKLYRKGYKPLGISNKQRQHSGVPFCSDILKRIRGTDIKR
ncbi:reverse transcriptase domain-containing protein [Sphingobacterium arenae]|uniref:RNA-directed DNA polymerase n=1 Tax=Sphingobacterium arenae TaxID=1280598 RepID=A0ABR7Y456_9SPHI|nr:reverse transcriptase domain-containing protein [Sphingobacterium arenae]MBD1426081.1 hypothetical protein [Sphingobacterium arenae]